MKSVSITLIVMKMETASVIATGLQLLTVISTADHAGRTALSQLEIVTHVDAMAQLSTTVMHVLSIPTAQLTDTALVTKTGETQPMVHATIIPENVTTDAQMDATDQPMLTVKSVSSMLLELHVNVMPFGVERTVSTSMANVLQSVTDAQDLLPVTVPVVYQMPNVIVKEIVSVNQASGL